MSLPKAEGEIGLDELDFCPASGVAENQMVGLGVRVGCWYAPIHQLIVSRIQFVGDTLRLAVQEIVKFALIQQNQINVSAFVAGGVRIAKLRKRSEVPMQPGILLARRDYECKLGVVIYREYLMQKILRLWSFDLSRGGCH